MPVQLIVEDGSMPDGANTYVDAGFVDAYLEARGNAAWLAANDDVRTIALVRAADVLNSYRWKGVSSSPGRIMAWPRKNVAYADATPVPENVIPAQVKNAQCELAALINGGENPLAPVAHAGKIISESHSVTDGGVDVLGADSHSDSYTYEKGVSYETLYPAIVGLLRDFLETVPGVVNTSACLEVGRG
jgi:hypothetical protein